MSNDIVHIKGDVESINEIIKVSDLRSLAFSVKRNLKLCGYFIESRREKYHGEICIK